MSESILIDASLRFAQKNKAAEVSSDLPFEQQQQIIAEEMANMLMKFCPEGFQPITPNFTLFPQPVNGLEPQSILDEVVVSKCSGSHLLFTDEFIKAVDYCYSPYFEIAEEYSGDGFQKNIETLKVAARIMAVNWLFVSLDPREVHAEYKDNPIFLASMQAGILPKGEGDIDAVIDVARYRVIGAAARSGLSDDERYLTFQATYRAMFEQRITEEDHGGIPQDRYIGIKFAMMYACSDERAKEMLARMHNINMAIERYVS